MYLCLQTAKANKIILWSNGWGVCNLNKPENPKTSRDSFPSEFSLQLRRTEHQHQAPSPQLGVKQRFQEGMGTGRAALTLEEARMQKGCWSGKAFDMNPLADAFGRGSEAQVGRGGLGRGAAGALWVQAGVSRAAAPRVISGGALPAPQKLLGAV